MESSTVVAPLYRHLRKVFKEAYRVLKIGGKMYVSDIDLLGKLIKAQLIDEDLLSGCVAGALQKDDFWEKYDKQALIYP